MTALIEFLRARLDEDEAVAARTSEVSWRYNPRKAWHSPPPAFGVFAPAEEFVAAGSLTDPLCIAATGPADNLESMADAEHIARWDPARVLADVAAKRRIIEWVDVAEDRSVDPDAWVIGKEVLRALAEPYADHPDFDPAWRTT